jgi:hypothetical protein
MVNYDSLEVYFKIFYYSYSNSNLFHDLEQLNKYQNIILEIYKKIIHKNLNVILKAL